MVDFCGPREALLSPYSRVHRLVDVVFVVDVGVDGEMYAAAAALAVVVGDVDGAHAGVSGTDDADVDDVEDGDED